VAFCIARLFAIASDLKQLLRTPPDELNRLIHSAAWCVAIFFTTFSLSHWLFAMQYWSLSLKLRNLVFKKSQDNLRTKVLIVNIVGIIAFLISGALVVSAIYNYRNNAIQYSSEFANVLPAFVAIGFLIDALYRLKTLAHGSMHIETWQIIWHVWSFVLVCICGILLSVATIHTWKNPGWFYATYLSIICLIFMCEVPFLYIINKIVT